MASRDPLGWPTHQSQAYGTGQNNASLRTPLRGVQGRLDFGRKAWQYQCRYEGSHLQRRKRDVPAVRSIHTDGISAMARLCRNALTVSSRFSSNPARLSMLMDRSMVASYSLKALVASWVGTPRR